jgi:hypothetical protein
MRQLVYNAVTCTECNETIVSYHRHDYKTCSCPNEAAVDGGLDYLRYGAKDLNKIKSIALYADDDFVTVRCYATRGSRGKDGKQPLTQIPIKDMDDDYLEAVLEYGGADWHLELIRKEIEYRKFKIHQKESITELMNMNEVTKFRKRLKKIGYEIELQSNVPWIYLHSVNGNKIKEEDWINSNHGYCLAWYPLYPNDEIKINQNDIKTTFMLIRKYGKPIHKYNNGIGATLCHDCGVIISEGLTKDLRCEKCTIY